MGIRRVIQCAAAALWAGVAWAGGPLAAGALFGVPPLERAAQALQELPAWFEPAVEETGGSATRFVFRGGEYRLLLQQSGAILTLGEEDRRCLLIALAGGSPNAALEPDEPRPGRTDYLVGNDRRHWRRGVPQYGKVRYRQVYPGIDLEYRANGRKLEYDFVVAAGADPRRIRLRFAGADRVRLDRNGALVLSLGEREIRQSPPYAFQEWTENGRAVRKPVPSRYQLARNGEVRVVVGEYDRRRSLVIDPVLAYAGYFGGDRYDVPTGIDVDKDGYVWITGTTRSRVTIPADTFPYRSEIGGSQDVFVAKLKMEPAGPPTLHYWTYLGGSYDDRGGLIRVMPSGLVFLTGLTYSADFPVTSNAAQGTAGTVTDIFATVLDPSQGGQYALAYSTFLGGTGFDAPTAMYVAPDETMYIAGYGASVDIKSIPSDAVQPNNRGGWDALLFHIDPHAADSASSLLFSTYYGGWSTDIASGVAADAAGNIYLTGYTMSDDFPIEGNLYQGALRSPCDLFIVKLDPSREGLDRIVYGTYLGGSSVDIATAMKMDAGGGLWITGYTLSADLPVTAGALQGAFAGGVTDAFLLRFDPSAPPSEAITYLTYFGGSGTEVFYDLQLLGKGRVALAGYTLSSDFPLAGAPPAGQQKSGGSDAVIAIVDTTLPGAASLIFSTYLGGQYNEQANRLAVARNGAVYVVGDTYSADLPVTDGSVRLAPLGSQTGFLARVDPEPGEQPAAPPVLPSEGQVDGVTVVPRRSGLSVEPQPRRQSR